MSKYKEGDVIVVMVDGVAYPTHIIDGVQRFIRNKAIRRAVDLLEYGLNTLMLEACEGKIPKIDFMEFHMLMGYSVCGFAEIFPSYDDERFGPVEIINPVWESDDEPSED